MMSRLPFCVVDVATARSCRDLFLSPTDVATLVSLQIDVATASDSVLMSRLHPDVAIYMFSQLSILCRDLRMMSRHHVFFFINSWLFDFELLSRPARFVFNYASFATGALIRATVG